MTDRPSNAAANRAANIRAADNRAADNLTAANPPDAHRAAEEPAERSRSGSQDGQARFLSTRRSDLVEWMDRPDCDPVKLHNTYRYFPVINRLISRWNAVYRHYIRPHLRKGQRFTLLDVGSGGGDITKNIHAWAVRDGFLLEVTGIDPDGRALEYARGGTSKGTLESRSDRGDGMDREDWTDTEPAGLRFLQADTGHLRREGKTFDFVVCNHVLHHLSDEGIATFLDDLAALSSRRVICSDIERSAIGYALFLVATWPLFPNSFIRADGLISIQKSYRPDELRAVLPQDWRVVRQFPFRLLVLYDKAGFV